MTEYQGTNESFDAMPVEGVQMDSNGGMPPVFNPSAVKVERPLETPKNASEPMPITNIIDLKQYARGNVVRLSDFGDGMPFVVRMRRPSIMALAKAGKIPNALLSSANQLFASGSMDSDNSEMLSDLLEVCEILADTALIEPTYKDIKAAGIELTDEQMMEIFSYTQTGVDALKSFRD